MIVFLKFKKKLICRYKLLMKMGWTKGKGLGKRNHGSVEPLHLSITANDAQLGLGKSQEYDSV
jgi:hypothetical protein